MRRHIPAWLWLNFWLNMKQKSFLSHRIRQITFSFSFFQNGFKVQLLRGLTVDQCVEKISQVLGDNLLSKATVMDNKYKETKVMSWGVLGHIKHLRCTREGITLQTFYGNRPFHLRKTRERMSDDSQMFWALFAGGNKMKIWEFFFSLRERKLEQLETFCCSWCQDAVPCRGE